MELRGPIYEDTLCYMSWNNLKLKAECRTFCSTKSKAFSIWQNVLFLGWRLSAKAAYYGNATRDRTHDENVASEDSQKN